MRAIDTHVLVRLIVRDDPEQVVEAEAFIQGGAWVSVLALAEATWVLSTVYELSSAQVTRTIEMLLDHKDLVLQDADSVAEALKAFRAAPKLGFSDCLMIQLARKAGYLPLGTFDRDLSKAPGAQRL